MTTAAVEYNKGRPYTSGLWARIQEVVGTTADGIPGSKTAAAIESYQRATGLPADGKCGRNTFSAMSLQDMDGDLFLGHIAIDADGAPNAYNPENTGIDYLGNAGRPGNWWGISTDDDGNPYTQCRHDPNPGYYVSTTALIDPDFDETDTERYVDSTEIPYIALTRSWRDLSTSRPYKGDLAMVVRVSNLEVRTFAIYADVGPSKNVGDTMGELSIAAAQNLGHDPYRVRDGILRADIGSSAEFAYIVFPGSGYGRPLSADDINAYGSAAFDAWGGDARLYGLFA
jgi:hypothetical protein